MSTPADVPLDMFARCMARQQGDEASVRIYGTENAADREWLTARQGAREDAQKVLPLPPPAERGAVEGHRDFQVEG